MDEKFRCEQCGKAFDSKDSLMQHTQAKHAQQQEQPKQNTPKKISKSFIIIGVIIVLIVLGSAYFLFFNNPSGQSNLVGSLVSSDDYSKMSSVSFNTLNSIKSGSATGLIKVTGTTLTSNGKPVVLYIGADYCPYCASERWPLIVALSKFGNFTGLTYMLSSPTDVSSNTPTFSFEKTSYTSDYISFQTVETQDRFGHLLQIPTTDQGTLMQTYDSAGSIPFVDIGNRYILVGSQFQPSIFSGNWSQIASQLDNPNSNVAQKVDGAANILISSICQITNHQPASVCNQTFANLQG